MGEAVLSLRPPDGLKVKMRPEIRDRRAGLGHLAECIAELVIAPLQMPLLIDEEDRLRETIHGVVHDLVHITDDAHTVAFKSPLPVTTPFPRKRGQHRP